MNLYTVPNVTFKPDFGAGEESAKAMPWFREGSAHCWVENPRKTAFLGKTLLSEQNHPTQGPAADPLLQVGLKGSWAVVKHLSVQPRQERAGPQPPSITGARCPDLAPIVCRSSHQKPTLQADSCSWGSKYNLRYNTRSPRDLPIERKQPLVWAKRSVDGLAGEAVMVYQLSGDYSTVNNCKAFCCCSQTASLKAHFFLTWFGYFYTLLRSAAQTYPNC